MTSVTAEKPRRHRGIAVAAESPPTWNRCRHGIVTAAEESLPPQLQIRGWEKYLRVSSFGDLFRFLGDEDDEERLAAANLQLRLKEDFSVSKAFKWLEWS